MAPILLRSGPICPPCALHGVAGGADRFLVAEEQFAAALNVAAGQHVLQLGQPGFLFFAVDRQLLEQRLGLLADRRRDRLDQRRGQRVGAARS